jgi:hypothetical protein
MLPTAQLGAGDAGSGQPITDVEARCRSARYRGPRSGEPGQGQGKRQDEVAQHVYVADRRGVHGPRMMLELVIGGRLQTSSTNCR